MEMITISSKSGEIPIRIGDHTTILDAVIKANQELKKKDTGGHITLLANDTVYSLNPETVISKIPNREELVFELMTKEEYAKYVENECTKNYDDECTTDELSKRNQDDENYD